MSVLLEGTSGGPLVTLTSVRHRLEYSVVVVTRAVVRVLPDAVVRGLGAVVGLVFYALDRSHRELTVRQLREAFPARSEAECRAIARATFAHFGRALFTLLEFSGFSREEIGARVEFEGLERLRGAMERGRGVIVFSGHFGFWELYMLAHPLVLPPLTVVARSLDNPLLHRLLEAMRGATGNTSIYKHGAVRRMLRALAAHGTVATTIDQYLGTADAVAVEFFGRPAPTSSAIAALALRTGAPLVPMFALPLPGGRYRVVFEPAVEVPAAGEAEPVRVLTQRCTDVLERYVRLQPHLWLWMHRRWREPPAPAASGT